MHESIGDKYYYASEFKAELENRIFMKTYQDKNDRNVRNIKEWRFTQVTREFDLVWVKSHLTHNYLFHFTWFPEFWEKNQ